MIRRFVCSLIILLVLYGTSFAGTISTSGITAGIIIDRVRRDLNEITASYWTDADLLQWTNEAVWTITGKAACLEKTSFTITLASNTWQYDLASGNTTFLSVRHILYNSGNTTSDKQVYSLDRTTLDTFGRTSEKGNPKVFLAWDDDLFIWPIPRSNQSGTTLHVFTVTLPSGVTVSASPIETPEYFDPILLIYIKAKAMFKDDRPATGNFYMRLFDAKTKEYINNIIKRAP